MDAPEHARQRAAHATELARAALREGRIDLADRIARELDAFGLATRGSWIVVARVAALLNRPDVVRDALRRAEPLARPETPPLDPDLVAAARAPDPTPPAPTARPRYLLIRAWGQGFWSDVSHVLGQILTAEITGRTPVVHWGANSRFGSDTSNANAWDHYFLPVSDRALSDIPGRWLSYFPPKWRDDNLKVRENGALQGPYARIGALMTMRRSEDVVVSDFHTPLSALRHWIPPWHRLHGASLRAVHADLIARYIRPRPEIVERTDRAWGALGHGPFVAVHVRGSDKAVEIRGLKELTDQYPAHLDSLLRSIPGARILLLTDWQPAVAEYRARYADRLVTTDAQRTSDRVGLHFQKAVDGRQLGEEVLVDTLLASRCDAFVGLGNSNVSAFIDLFGRAPVRARAWTDETSFLVGPHLHESLSVGLLMPALPRLQ